MCVPVLLLQPFVENAVKHGVSPCADGGTISLIVRIQDGRVLASIEDDGVGLGNSPHRGAGKTIENCRERLRLTYGDRARVDMTERKSGGTRVALSWPFQALV